MDEWEKWAEELRATHQAKAARALELLKAHTFRAKFIVHFEQPTWTDQECWNYSLAIAQSMVAAEIEK